MGNTVVKEAGMTGASIEEYWAAHATEQSSRGQLITEEEDAILSSPSEREEIDPDRRTEKSEKKKKTAPKAETVASNVNFQGFRNVALMSDAAPTPVTVHIAAAIRALQVKSKDAFNTAIEALRKIDFIDIAKALSHWTKKHRWEIATVVIPLILLACTPALLGALGFTAGGIAAGSIAAGIQAGIGSVAGGSTFAILTSAAMGGYGVPIVFGSVWGVSSAIMAGIAAWKRWRAGLNGSGTGDNSDQDGGNGLQN